MFRVECSHTATIDGQPFTVAHFVRLFVRAEQAFGRNLQALYAGSRIDAACEESLKRHEGRVVLVESGDMPVLRAALEAPTNGYLLSPPLVAVPFVRAVLDAQEGAAAVRSS